MLLHFQVAAERNWLKQFGKDSKDKISLECGQFLCITIIALLLISLKVIKFDYKIEVVLYVHEVTLSI